MDVRKKISYADNFIIATCRSSFHAKATAAEMIKKLKKIGVKCPNPEGKINSEWIIVDTGPVIIHLFAPEIRKIYNLEKLWEINFDTLENKLA